MSFIIGVIVGFIAACYLYVSIQEKRSKGGPAKSFKMYLNIFVHNKKEVVENQVKKKFEEKGRPAFLGSLVGKLAGSMVSDDSIITKVSEKLSEEVPKKLREIGVTANVSVAYQKKAYLCMLFVIEGANFTKLVEEKAGAEKASKVDYMMELLSNAPQVKESVDGFLLHFIGEKIQEKIPEIFKEKSYEKAGLDTTVVACSETEQSSFFIETIKGLEV